MQMKLFDYWAGGKFQRYEDLCCFLDFSPEAAASLPLVLGKKKQETFFLSPAHDKAFYLQTDFIIIQIAFATPVSSKMLHLFLCQNTQPMLFFVGKAFYLGKAS